MENTLTATPPVEEAGEIYALAFRNGYAEKLFDCGNVQDKVHNAISAVSIGELTDKQFIALLCEFEKKCAGWIRKDGGFIVTFVMRRTIRSNSVLDFRLKALLGNEIPLTSYGHQQSLQESALNIAIDLANDIRGTGRQSAESESALPPTTADNALLQALAVDYKQHMGLLNRLMQEVQSNPSAIAVPPVQSARADSTSQPKEPAAAKKKTKKTRMRNPGKYEVHVLNFLVSMKESVLRGNISSALIENLAATDIAKHLSESVEFQNATISSIVDKVLRTNAWKNRKKTFSSIYDTETFRNRQTSNDPYQEVQ